MKEYFVWSECSNHGNQLGPNWDLWKTKDGYVRFEGSFRLITARIAGVPYDQWLLYCESKGGRLIGKETAYPGVIFDKKNEEIRSFLNERANKIFEKISMEDLIF